MTLQNSTPRGKQKQWLLADAPDAEKVRAFSEELRIPVPVANILLRREIDTFEKAKLFFRPSLEHLHDPFLMSDMEIAVTRVEEALKAKERIRVYGDYDVDGTNGAALVYTFLSDFGGNVDYFIPDRLREGYGLSKAGIEKAHSAGVNLLISVDCGITAIDEVKYAKSLGMDVIICDHHEVGQEIPPAVAVLDPLKPGDIYPFKGLCGCGVAFKLVQAVAQQADRTDILSTYLDFVTLATIADIVPLVGENRVLTKTGLESLNQSPRPGVKALMECAGLRTSAISTGQIVFALAPRINAVGRLGDAMRAVRLLISSDEGEGAPLARVLEEENLERRKIDEATFNEARQIIDDSRDFIEESAIVLHSSSWHPGVVGIVASRMVERYYKPSVMLATVDGVIKGSARSVPGFDIYDALTKCSDSIVQFGGHKYAAGLTLEPAMVEPFARKFKDIVGASLPEELKTPKVKIDLEISLSDLTPKFVRILKEFAPFGPGNPRPVFLTRNLEVIGSPRIVGKNHLKFKVRENGIVVDAIGFGLGDHLEKVKLSVKRHELDCVFSIDESDRRLPSGEPFGGGVPQLKIRDVRVQTREPREESRKAEAGIPNHGGM